MMCCLYSNWYPASFCLEAIECTDRGWERMPVLCVSSAAHSSLSRFSNSCCIDSSLSQTFWLGPHGFVYSSLLQFHYWKSQVSLVHQGLLQVWLQLPGWWLTLISRPFVCSLVQFKPSVLKWHVLWQKLHSHAYTRAMVCSFVSFTHYLIYLRRWIAKKIRLWHCLLHCSFPSHSW
jgi:hypothetical protein